MHTIDRILISHVGISIIKLRAIVSAFSDDDGHQEFELINPSAELLVHLNQALVTQEVIDLSPDGLNQLNERFR